MEGFKLSHFKKIHEDDHKAVLQHPKGHKITIAKPALSEKMRSQLKELPIHKAEGGAIEENPLYKMYGQKEEPNAELISTGQPVNASSLAPMEGMQEPPPVIPEEPGVLSKIGNFLTGGNSLINPAFKGSIPESNPKSAKELIEEGRAGKLNPEPQAPTLKEAPSNYNLAGLPGFQNVSNSGSGMNPLFAATQAQSNAYLSGLGQRIAGEKAQANVIGQQAEAQANEINSQVAHQQQLAQNYQTHFNEMNQEMDHLRHDINTNQINPRQYLEDMSTGGKISTALGMLLSGLGGSKENSVTTFLNQQIDRNINAQKANIDKKNNLLSALTQQQGNLHTATNMMQALYKNMYADKITEIANKFAGPQAQAKAQELAGQWKQEAAQVIGNAAQTKALMQMNTGGGGSQQQQQDPAILVRMLVPDHEKAKAYEEIKDQQNINRVNKDAMEAWDKIARLQTVASRLGSPLQSKSQINALWDPMVEQVAKNTTGRAVPLTVELLAALKPGLSNSAETLNVLRQKFWNTLNGERSTPVLDAYRIPVNKNIGLVQRNAQVGGGYAQAGSGKKGSVASK